MSGCSRSTISRMRCSPNGACWNRLDAGYILKSCCSGTGSPCQLQASTTTSYFSFRCGSTAPLTRPKPVIAAKSATQSNLGFLDIC